MNETKISLALIANGGAEADGMPVGGGDELGSSDVDEALFTSLACTSLAALCTLAAPFVSAAQ